MYKLLLNFEQSGTYINWDDDDVDNEKDGGSKSYISMVGILNY